MLRGHCTRKDFIGRDRQSEPFFIPVRDILAEREVSLGCRILECISSFLLQHSCRSLPDPVDIDKRRVREPPGRKEMISGFAVTLRISRMNDLGVFAILDANV
jgi:hypothetical protein